MTRTTAPSAVGSARLLARLFLVCTMLGSGGYVLLYLWRWEWNRALISGLFFLASETALLAFHLSGRLSRLERAVAQAVDAAGADRATAAADALAAARPSAPERFAWLEPTSTHLGVFVPVLMGAGVLLSAVAWGVERLARATAGPALERRLARRLAPLTIGALDGGLVPPSPAPSTPVPLPFRPGRG